MRFVEIMDDLQSKADGMVMLPSSFLTLGKHWLLFF